jgi:hypothetical protein
MTVSSPTRTSSFSAGVAAAALGRRLSKSKVPGRGRYYYYYYYYYYLFNKVTSGG